MAPAKVRKPKKMGEHSVFSSDETGGFEARDLLRAALRRCLFFGLNTGAVSWLLD